MAIPVIGIAQAKKRKKQKMTEHNRTITTIDNTTGEIVDETTVSDDLTVGTDLVLQDMEAGRVPLYVQKLLELNIPEEEKESLLSMYTGVSTSLLADYVNTDIEVIGAAILYHGPYQGKDKLTHEGYYYTVLLTTEETKKGDLVVLRTSGVGIMQHMTFALAKKGWFLWDVPVKYRVTKGEDGAYRLRNTDRPSVVQKLLASRKAGK